MKSSTLILLALTQIGAFAPPTYTTKRSTVTCFGFTEEFEEIWSQAAKAGADAVLTTADLVKDRAFDFKKEAMDRISIDAIQDITEHAVEQAAAEFADVKEHLEKKFDIVHKEALSRAGDRFMKTVAKAERQLAHSIHCAESAYDRELKRAKHWNSDVVHRAKSRYIQAVAAAEELFQIAVEKAELSFEETRIKAEDIRNLQKEYFEKNGEYMVDEMAYISSFFSNLIAF